MSLCNSNPGSQRNVRSRTQLQHKTWKISIQLAKKKATITFLYKTVSVYHNLQLAINGFSSSAKIDCLSASKKRTNPNTSKKTTL